MTLRAQYGPGVRRHGAQLVVRVMVNGEPASQAFPLTATPAVIQAWRTVTKQRLAVPCADAPPLTTGTLEHDVPGFLAQIAGRSCFKADRSHLRAWLAAVGASGVPLGTLPRAVITTADINVVIAAWQTAPSVHAVRRIRVTGYTRARARGAAPAVAGETLAAYERLSPATSGTVVAARTIRHRCRLLAELYHTLDGPKAPTPVDDARVPAPPKTAPEAIPPQQLQTVLEQLRVLDEATFCRYAIFCTTMQRPAQIMRARPRDVDLRARTWLVRSAKQEPAHTITLTAEAVSAWKRFIAANAWGAFDTSTYGKLIHQAGLPPELRPYGGRHSGAQKALQAGVNLGDLQAVLGHSSPDTTRRFYAPFVLDQQRKVSTKLENRFPTAFAPRLVKKGGR